MISILVAGYILCVLLGFSFIKLKVTPRKIAVAAFVGIVVQVATIVVWKQAAPMTGQMILKRRVLQVVPDVREFVSKVHVKPDQKVSKGDPLFDILPDRFEDAVDEAKANLAAAITTVSQLEAAVTVAESSLKQEQAESGAARAEYQTAQNLQNENPGAIAGLTVEEKRQALLADEADDKVGEATVKQARFALGAAQKSVASSQAALKTAQFNLMRCTFTSPVDGQVVNWQIREGTPVARYRFTGIGTVQSFADNAVLAIYPQNLLTNVKPNDEVEIAFKRRPGEIVTGKVQQIVEYTGEGQFDQTSMLPSAANVGSQGYLSVLIYLDDEELAKELPLGAAGTTAIYTDYGKPLHLMTKIAVRIKAWMYRLLPI